MLSHFSKPRMSRSPRTRFVLSLKGCLVVERELLVMLLDIEEAAPRDAGKNLFDGSDSAHRRLKMLTTWSEVALAFRPRLTTGTTFTFVVNECTNLGL